MNAKRAILKDINTANYKVEVIVFRLGSPLALFLFYFLVLKGEKEMFEKSMLYVVGFLIGLISLPFVLFWRAIKFIFELGEDILEEIAFRKNLDQQIREIRADKYKASQPPVSYQRMESDSDEEGTL